MPINGKENAPSVSCGLDSELPAGEEIEGVLTLIRYRCVIFCRRSTIETKPNLVPRSAIILKFGGLTHLDRRTVSGHRVDTIEPFPISQVCRVHLVTWVVDNGQPTTPR